MKNEIEQIKQQLQTPKKIVAIGHINPDGDAVGSALALSFFLRKLGHECHVLLPDMLDYTLRWLPDAQNITIFKQHPEQAKEYIEQAAILFCLDSNNLSRMGEMAKFVDQNTNIYKILIDHHLNPNIEAFDTVISTSRISSTAELVYNFIKNYDGQDHFTRDIATVLYVGIITDTGSLSYACENTSVYHAIADIVEKGIDTQYIRSYLYNMLPESRLRLMGYGLFAKMKVMKALRTAYIVLSQEELHWFHYQKGDSEGLVNYCISMKNIVFGCIMIEHLERIQLSFRSRGNFDVSRFAIQHFSGGGHKNAAGGTSYTSLADTVAKFETVVQQYKEDILSVKI